MAQQSFTQRRFLLGKTLHVRIKYDGVNGDNKVFSPAVGKNQSGEDTCSSCTIKRRVWSDILHCSHPQNSEPLMLADFAKSYVEKILNKLPEGHFPAALPGVYSSLAIQQLGYTDTTELINSDGPLHNIGALIRNRVEKTDSSEAVYGKRRLETLYILVARCVAALCEHFYC